MPVKKSSSKENKTGINYEPAIKAGKYGSMIAFYLLVIAAVTACIFFIVYAHSAHGEVRDGDYVDPYEHDYGRMTISAYATIIALLASILILVFYITYLVHNHLKY